MKILIYTLPVSILVAYSQLIVKWRTSGIESHLTDTSFLGKMINYFSDPFIFSAYFSALLASFVWLWVVSKIPLSIGFPVYIGSAFLMVMLGSFLFLGEAISSKQFIAGTLIFMGILLGGMD